MSSYIMHMCISDVVRKKLGLTEKFVYGSVLPDILKTIQNDRTSTHYIEKVTLPNGDIRNLPQIDKAIKQLDIRDREIKLGYIAHLIEDYIWFNEYIPSYTKRISAEQVLYLETGELHTNNEFGQDIYSDYANSSFYVTNSCNVNIYELISNIEQIVSDKKYLEVMLPNLTCNENVDVASNKLMTKESIDKYINQCTNEVQSAILKLMGE